MTNCFWCKSDVDDEEFVPHWERHLGEEEGTCRCPVSSVYVVDGTKRHDSVRNPACPYHGDAKETVDG
jgi:hypothetical protein